MLFEAHDMPYIYAMLQGLEPVMVVLPMQQNDHAV